MLRVAILAAMTISASACGDDVSAAGGGSGNGGAGGAAGVDAAGGSNGTPDARDAEVPIVDASVDAPAGNLRSWNPNVRCSAVLTTIEAVIGNQTNSAGGATYAGGGFKPGIPSKNSLAPPCVAGGVLTFVEIHGVTILQSGFAEPAGDGDYTFGLTDTSSSRTLNRRSLHAEIPASWMSAGIAPARNYSVGERIDIQGFVFWDPYHVTDGFHFYSGWEIHPITAWRAAR